MGLIYCMTSPSGKKYIGQTIQPVNDRVYQHTKEDGCAALYGAIEKYGIENFEVEVLLVCDNKLLDYYETLFIEMNRTLVPNGYNIRKGGARGAFCDESKEKMRQSKLGAKNPNYGKPKSEEFKQIMSQKKSGENHHFYGKTFTLEHKERLSKSHKKDNLPMYLVYIKARPEHYCSEGYAIANHPTVKNKHFTSKKLSLEEKLRLAMEYLNSGRMEEVQRLNGSGSQTEA